MVFSGIFTTVTGIKFGALYYWSKSLYLVGMFNGTMNILLNTLHLEGTEIGGLLMHALALLLVVVVALRRSRASRVR